MFTDLSIKLLGSTLVIRDKSITSRHVTVSLCLNESVHNIRFTAGVLNRGKFYLPRGQGVNLLHYKVKQTSIFSIKKVIVLHWIAVAPYFCSQKKEKFLKFIAS